MLSAGARGLFPSLRQGLTLSPYASLFPQASTLLPSSSLALTRGYAAFDDRPERQERPDRLSITRSVVAVRRTAKVTKGGRIISFSVMVVVGNGKGGAGYALGKALSVSDATKKATVRAMSSMRFIPRYMNSTIYHQIDHVFHKSRIRLWPANQEYGIRTHHAIQAICHCAGIQSLGAKVHGSRNIINVVRGTFEALESQETHLERSRRLGLKAVDINQTYFDRQMEINEKYNQLQLELLKSKLAQKNSFARLDDGKEKTDEFGFPLTQYKTKKFGKNKKRPQLE